MSGVLIEALEDGLLTLTLNRPERRNALDTAMLESLVDATRRAATNPAVSAVMLTGAGGAFCVGGDVKAMPPNRPDRRRSILLLLGSPEPSASR